MAFCCCHKLLWFPSHYENGVKHTALHPTSARRGYIILYFSLKPGGRFQHRTQATRCMRRNGEKISSGFYWKREVEMKTIRCDATRCCRRSFSLPRVACIATASLKSSRVVTALPNEREQQRPLRGFSNASKGRQEIPRNSHTSRKPLIVRCFLIHLSEHRFSSSAVSIFVFSPELESFATSPAERAAPSNHRLFINECLLTKRPRSFTSAA